MDERRRSLWLPFVEGSHKQIAIGERLSFRRHIINPCISLASYETGDTGLTAWANEVQDPSRGVMFLITDIEALRPTSRYSAGGYSANMQFACPKRIITDTKKWCPLIIGVDNKFRSSHNWFSSGYEAMMLNEGDQQVISDAVTQFINKTWGDIDEG